MTVAAFPPYTYYLGDGVQTAFAVPFEVERSEEFVAYVDDVLVTNYQLSGVGEETGGQCTFSAPLPLGASLLLLRQVVLDQETMYPAYSPFPAAAHEKTLDRLCMQVWQLQEQLERTTRFKQTIRPPWRNLPYPDPLPNTVLGWDSAGAQWTLYPFGVTQIPVDPVSGIGWGKNTVEIRPALSATQAQALVFPAGVLALAVSVWIAEDLGTTQGLAQVGIGTPAQPTRWGYLNELSAETETSAGLFEGYSGQPMGDGQVTLTAYGGRFDGTGAVYVTGHFATYRPSHAAGYTYHPGGPEDSAPLPFGYATTTQAGLVELGTEAEILDGNNPLVVPTAATLQAKWDTLPGVQPGTETQAGIVELSTPAETVTGTDTSRATHAAGVKAALDAGLAPVVSDVTALATTTATHTSQIGTLQATDATHTSQIATLDAKVPPGTPLRVVRYAASGQTVETGSASVVIDASGRLGVGQVTPLSPLHVVGEFRIEQGFQRIQRDAAPALLQATSAGDVALTHVGKLQMQRAGGTLASRSAVQTGWLLGQVSWEGYSGAGYSLGAQLDVLSEEAFTTSTLGTRVMLSTAQLGTATLTERLRINSQGQIGLHTTLSATLGSGASYQALNVKGSTLYCGQSSVQERPMTLVDSTWATSTDASRKARLTINAYDHLAAREGLRVEADGAAPRIGFLGANAVVRQTVPAAATDAGTTQTLANSLRTALVNLGLCA